MSDTPRTDAKKCKFSYLCAEDDAYWVPALVCSQIERENNALRECVKRLEEAGDAIVENGSVSERLHNEWMKAKEDKP